MNIPRGALLFEHPQRLNQPLQASCPGLRIDSLKKRAPDLLSQVYQQADDESEEKSVEEF